MLGAGPFRPYEREPDVTTSRSRAQLTAQARRDQAAAAGAADRLRILAGAAVLAAVTLAVVAVIALTGGRTTAQRVRAARTGATVDGIACQTS